MPDRAVVPCRHRRRLLDGEVQLHARRRQRRQGRPALTKVARLFTPDDALAALDGRRRQRRRRRHRRHCRRRAHWQRSRRTRHTRQRTRPARPHGVAEECVTKRRRVGVGRKDVARRQRQAMAARRQQSAKKREQVGMRLTPDQKGPRHPASANECPRVEQHCAVSRQRRRRRQRCKLGVIARHSQRHAARRERRLQALAHEQLARRTTTTRRGNEVAKGIHGEDQRGAW